MILKEVPSGSIELVQIAGGLQSLQFNCSCEDALPYCKGMCCKLQHIYNVIIDKEEVPLYKTQPHPKHPQLNILQSANGECVYVNGNLCGIHETKPKGCRQWHCSPRGVGEGIVLRDNGWALLPMHGDLQTKEALNAIAQTNN